MFDAQVIGELLREMETRHIKPVEGCYTSLIVSYCRVSVIGLYESGSEFVHGWSGVVGTIRLIYGRRGLRFRGTGDSR